MSDFLANFTNVSSFEINKTLSYLQVESSTYAIVAIRKETLNTSMSQPPLCEYYENGKVGTQLFHYRCKNKQVKNLFSFFTISEIFEEHFGCNFVLIIIIVSNIIH